jgi:hypothetical protein
MPATLYCPVWVAAGGHKVIRRGPDCASAAEAAGVVKDKLAAGYASLGVVIKVHGDGSRDLMDNNIYPPGARKVIDHYEMILDSLEG